MKELTTSELRVILKFKKLPTTGLKEDLIRRLQVDQQYPSQTIKKSNALLSEKERKQATDVTAIRYFTNMSITQKENELYRREAILYRKEKELAERELAFMKKELEKIQQVQINTNGRTHEKSRCFHKTLDDRHSGGDRLVPKRDEDTKQRTERKREQSKTPSRCLNCGQRDHSEANCRTKYKDAKYHFKYTKRHVASEYYNKNEERRHTYAREKPESSRPGPRRTIQIETPARYYGRRGFHFPDVK
ncbi:PREDICTED: uncharacterized protein LOC108762227 [Trachymyrmex cornetzi]|uniref:SAP domain-containing protein n=1 Tax=Trachymyrmex cornetzi TaxID=471704 RepID=A0A151J673_9HYME|nr:PREDICTED: uncharacterized protein LOC108762227 [Trachymyrmex cornetzi]XP_018364634.1 PREDICTED: uncharacterized protein LOC108762227 [Trachymyrmex cornetzi]KYN18705.1 hypothetical protein ALC57_08999 [Trachymyrmex cornetzi]